MSYTFRERAEQLRRMTAIRIGEYAPEQHDTVLLADVLILTDEMDRKVIELQCSSCVEAEEKITQLEAELAERTKELSELKMLLENAQIKTRVGGAG